MNINPQEYQSNFSLQNHDKIKQLAHKNIGNDIQLIMPLIIVHILVSSIGNVLTTVRRICILFLGKLWAALLFGKVHCTSKNNFKKN